MKFTEAFDMVESRRREVEAAKQALGLITNGMARHLLDGMIGTWDAYYDDPDFGEGFGRAVNAVVSFVKKNDRMHKLGKPYTVVDRNTIMKIVTPIYKRYGISV